jgi:hypothetical protein
MAVVGRRDYDYPWPVVFLFVTACAASEAAGPVDSAESCDEWEEEVWLSVTSAGSPCPEASEIGVDGVGRWQGCDGDEVVAILERVSDESSACSYLLNCDWSCTYRARVRRCAAQPTGCWII